jgi:hypothetical protein
MYARSEHESVLTSVHTSSLITNKHQLLSGMDAGGRSRKTGHELRHQNQGRNGGRVSTRKINMFRHLGSNEISQCTRLGSMRSADLYGLGDVTRSKNLYTSWGSD